MNGLLKLYSLPGKLLAELWYLWPKKGEVWASSRRRDHGFVHFLYSTVMYVLAFFMFAAGSADKQTLASDEAMQEVTASDNSQTSEVEYIVEPETEPTESLADEAENSVSVDLATDDDGAGIVYESNQVVQPLPDSSEPVAESVDPSE